MTDSKQHSEHAAAIREFFVMNAMPNHPMLAHLDSLEEQLESAQWAYAELCAERLSQQSLFAVEAS